ncbi:uncharacterized protein MYCGRDRAFT_93775 [Zymoseptoria tritici IPO323]|uniref:Uncharacterized protein n=1 Tax=Zymoseptoria tritici (strain CBS 115943 / IPO323) TaxID=336722 RepID=F9XCZ8_ZYMTI|nr:uncharacterized protein MYCGRDRAFT_93775 [Zymoseptoria tritici IPO323]EGP86400.1 hypothetical protein MYCGRDRAFT_93775 [Zymoseptoria tritici IPO323]
MAGQTSIPRNFEKPKTAFWRDLDRTIACNFFQAYPSKLQPSLELILDALSDRPRDERLYILIEILRERLPVRELRTSGEDFRPHASNDAEYDVWASAMLGIASAQDALGLEDEAERTTRIMINNGPHGEKDLGAQYSLAWRMEEKGRYGEAEEMALECMEWINGHRRCGPLSPQAICLWRLLIKTAWKSGRRALAEERILTTRDLITKMSRSRFAKYAQKEVEELVVTTVGLAKISKM